MTVHIDCSDSEDYCDAAYAPAEDIATNQVDECSYPLSLRIGESREE